MNTCIAEFPGACRDCLPSLTMRLNPGVTKAAFATEQHHYLNIGHEHVAEFGLGYCYGVSVSGYDKLYEWAEPGMKEYQFGTCRRYLSLSNAGNAVVLNALNT